MDSQLRALSSISSYCGDDLKPFEDFQGPRRHRKTTWVAEERSIVPIAPQNPRSIAIIGGNAASSVTADKKNLLELSESPL